MPGGGILAVGLGAAVGAWLRWGLSILFNPVFPMLPLGTLAANLSGGLMMGLAMGVGGMLIPVVGRIADLYSLPAVLYGLAVIPLLSIGPVYFFPEKRLREQPLAG
jgi:hypothetical protein